MAKKFYSICVGRSPGLYTDWDGPDGAQKQISGIKGYKYSDGYLGTNSREEAVDFLRNHTIRKVSYAFDIGEEIPFDQLGLEPAAEAAESTSPIVFQVTEKKKYTKPADYTPVKDSVRSFCAENGFGHLSDDQLRAVQAVEGKALLFAVPGSGKTTVIVARTGYMVRGLGIHPSQLMSLTFTRAAAAEMRKRYAKSFGSSCIPDFRTIHSLCWSIILPKLRGAGYVFPARQINDPIDDDEEDETGKKHITQNAIVRKILKKYKISGRIDDTELNAVKAMISNIKNRMLTSDDHMSAAGAALGKKLVIRKTEIPLEGLYAFYQEQIREHQVLDYDDMLWYAWDGLKKHPEALKELQKTYHYWSVDEAQDNSLLQNELIKLLVGQNGNLFMVGDDDQSIYAFRGAQPSLLLDYGEEPGIRKLVMDFNYRSCMNIVQNCRKLIETNQKRQNKQMQAYRSQAGEIVVWHRLTSVEQQYERIEVLARDARKDHEVAILYQMNASALPVMFRLWRARIPFKVSKDISDILRTKVIREILDIMRFSQNLRSVSLFWKCRGALGLWIDPKRRKQLEKVYEHGSGETVLNLLRKIYEKEERQDRTQTIDAVMPVLTEMADCSPSDAIILIVKNLGFDSFTTASEKLAFFGMINICTQCSTIPDLLTAMQQLCKFVSHEDDGDTEKEERREAENEFAGNTASYVALSTMHGAKGQEFNTVIIIDAWDDVLPGKAHWDRLGFDPEETLRLFYVALTRAKDHLEIMALGRYYGNIVKTSSYVWDFAAICDEKLCEDDSVLDMLPPAEKTEMLCVVEPDTYYAIPEGIHRGIYTSWDEVRAYTDGTPANSHRQTFHSREEAERYAYGSLQIKPLQSSRISSVITDTFQPFNKPMDLPSDIQHGMLDKWHISSLLDMSPETILHLQETMPDFSIPEKTDYHTKADSYLVLYLPVNFYKMWLPLSYLMNMGRLQSSLRVLDLGAGPGTSSLSLFSFYRELALDHPETHFSIELHAIEAEGAFEEHFRRIKHAFDENKPSNLTVQAWFHRCDAYRYLSEYQGEPFDLLMESNMMNEQEGIDDSAANTASEAIINASRLLKDNGLILLIEPGKIQNKCFLQNLANAAIGKLSCLFPASLCTTDLHAVSFNQEAVACGLRRKPLYMHWFSALVLSR